MIDACLASASSAIALEVLPSSIKQSTNSSTLLLFLTSELPVLRKLTAAVADAANAKLMPTRHL